MPASPKNKLPVHRLIAYEKAEAERQKWEEWLFRIMHASPTNTRSKDDLRAEAIRVAVGEGGASEYIDIDKSELSKSPACKP